MHSSRRLFRGDGSCLRAALHIGTWRIVRGIYLAASEWRLLHHYSAYERERCTNKEAADACTWCARDFSLVTLQTSRRSRSFQQRRAWILSPYLKSIVRTDFNNDLQIAGTVF